MSTVTPPIFILELGILQRATLIIDQGRLMGVPGIDQLYIFRQVIRVRDQPNEISGKSRGKDTALWSTHRLHQLR